MPEADQSTEPRTWHQHRAQNSAPAEVPLAQPTPTRPLAPLGFCRLPPKLCTLLCSSKSQLGGAVVWLWVVGDVGFQVPACCWRLGLHWDELPQLLPGAWVPGVVLALTCTLLAHQQPFPAAALSTQPRARCFRGGHGLHWIVAQCCFKALQILKCLIPLPTRSAFSSYLQKQIPLGCALCAVTK